MRMTPFGIIMRQPHYLRRGGFRVTVIVPRYRDDLEPSVIFRPAHRQKKREERFIIQNGCTYCHSQFIRAVDWGLGAERMAQAGDYIADRPHLLGSERTGPDLSQEGGEHPDDWHLAHFTNPRFVRPESIMPAFEFLAGQQMEALIAYKQSLGLGMRISAWSASASGKRRRLRPTRPDR